MTPTTETDIDTLKGGNKTRIILDLCAGTGAWSEPYLLAGYDVRRIT